MIMPDINSTCRWCFLWWLLWLPVPRTETWVI